MFERIENNQDFIKKYYNLDGEFTVHYAALGGSSVDTGNELVYALFEDNGKLYENIGKSWEPREITPFAIIQAIELTPQIREFYGFLPDFMAFLKELQIKTKSVVETLVENCKGFTYKELTAWIEERNDMELDELLSFSESIENVIMLELQNRLGGTLPTEYEDGEDECCCCDDDCWEDDYCCCNEEDEENDGDGEENNKSNVFSFDKYNSLIGEDELLESLEKHEFECSPGEDEKYDKEDDCNKEEKEEKDYWDYDPMLDGFVSCPSC